MFFIKITRIVRVILYDALMNTNKPKAELSQNSHLDKTLDLAERRVIRSALRDLRRREIEDMEAALASKRFRPTHLLLQEDKENQQG
ncbi:hypothetical protein N1851_007907 [Merluccius polli]|uniref:Smoothelin domain-containing protein n=1 Tax=Merluccius polli TaxID=89951 RepID=A0AA47P860_MERPO|nr:hypothetical protein N1851_007907 [Merluccius polli]